MKRTILALALLVALVLPGMAKAEGTGMYLAPKFLMTIQETGTIERYEESHRRRIRRMNPPHYDVVEIEKLARLR